MKICCKCLADECVTTIHVKSLGEHKHELGFYVFRFCLIIRMAQLKNDLFFSTDPGDFLNEYSFPEMHFIIPLEVPLKM